MAALLWMPPPALRFSPLECMTPSLSDRVCTRFCVGVMSSRSSSVVSKFCATRTAASSASAPSRTCTAPPVQAQRAWLSHAPSRSRAPLQCLAPRRAEPKSASPGPGGPSTRNHHSTSTSTSASSRAAPPARALGAGTGRVGALPARCRGAGLPPTAAAQGRSRAEHGARRPDGFGARRRSVEAGQPGQPTARRASRLAARGGCGRTSSSIAVSGASAAAR